jgi:cysteine synthase A
MTYISKHGVYNLVKKKSATYESYSNCIQPKIAENLTEALGIVPTIRIKRCLDVFKKHEMYLKLESCNPGGSIKEKNAAFLIQDAEKKNLLKKGGTIVESSSGNFGIGLAMMGAALDYRVIIVIDAKTPPPTRRILKAYGAELIEVPLDQMDKNGSMQVARMQKASEIAQELEGAWYPCQHKNPANPEAHTFYTAQEIAETFRNNIPDFLVIGVSTAGQISGISRFFRRNYPSVKIIGVDVAGSAVFGTPSYPYKMTGLGLSFIPPNFNSDCLDEAFVVGDELSFSLARLIAKKEGLLLGASTGAIMAVGAALAHRYSYSRKILMVNPDRGDRYLETIYDDQWMTDQNFKVLSKQEINNLTQDLKPVKLKSEDLF